jgi:uncharacterized cofD-like protein
MRQHPHAQGPLRIVAIGGGTGLSSLLHGLKQYAASGALELTAVVTVTDDGGSSGRLRREFEILPPGDIRNCMVALSEDEALVGKLFQYRFSAGSGLKGHNFGNLFLTALTDITGDFAMAVQLSSEVLAIYGRIYPSTRANVALEAELVNGKVVRGETKITKARSPIRQLRLLPEKPRPLPETLRAIEQADLITMGPGSLYTSVIPNLLVRGIAKAIAQSRARKACFVNLMWQKWETMQYTAWDHVAAINQHAGRSVVDTVVVNNRPISGSLRRRYAAEKVYPVEVDLPRLQAENVAIIGRNLLADAEKVRHDPATVAEIAMSLAREGRARRNLRS